MSIKEYELVRKKNEIIMSQDKGYETFIPLYITNHCDSKCKICNMRSQNEKYLRVEGTEEEIMSQLKIIFEVEGISAICFLSGEYNIRKYRSKNFKKIVWCIEQALKMGYEKVYFNIGALYDEEIEYLSRKLNGDERIVLSLFQETYDKECYKRFFGLNERDNPKSNYDLRVSTPKRWIKAGFKQVDLGILLGLHNPENDLKRLINHAIELHEMGAAVHISLPRIKGIDNIPFEITDEDFKIIIKELAESYPWIKLIVTTRETTNTMNDIIKFVKIISPGSSDVLPYTEKGKIPNNVLTSQFQVSAFRKRPSWVLDELNIGQEQIKYYYPKIQSSKCHSGGVE